MCSSRMWLPRRRRDSARAASRGCGCLAEAQAAAPALQQTSDGQHTQPHTDIRAAIGLNAAADAPLLTQQRLRRFGFQLHTCGAGGQVGATVPLTHAPIRAPDAPWALTRRWQTRRRRCRCRRRRRARRRGRQTQRRPCTLWRSPPAAAAARVRRLRRNARSFAVTRHCAGHAAEADGVRRCDDRLQLASGFRRRLVAREQGRRLRRRRRQRGRQHLRRPARAERLHSAVRRRSAGAFGIPIVSSLAHREPPQQRRGRA